MRAKYTIVLPALPDNAPEGDDAEQQKQSPVSAREGRR
jgi:hypothetical protein